MMPFQGEAWYWVESTYGGGASGTTYPISSYIQSIRVGTGDKGKDIRGIQSATVINRIEQTNEPVLSVEYHPQVGDYLIEDVIERSSCCTLQSLAFCVGANTCTGTAAYYYVVGCKPSTVRVSSSKNEPYTVSIDFQAKSITTSTTATGDEPVALTGAILQFNVAGSITKTGGHVVDTDKIAWITNSIDITVDHQLTGMTDHDSLYKTFLVEGTMDVKGNVDITLDDGGALHMDEVLAFTDFEIEITMGDAANSPVLTLATCYWDSTEVDVNVSGEAMMSSVPFTYVQGESTCTGIVDYVPA